MEFFKGFETPRYDIYTDCRFYPKFSNFGWETLYTNYKANMIRILDLENHKDISRLCLLLKLDLSQNILINTLSELHSYCLRRFHRAIQLTNELKEVLPNADPIYLDLVGEVFAFDDNGLNKFLEEVATKIKNYPRVVGYNEKLKALNVIKSLTVNFNVKEFLKMCPDPANYFKNLNRNIKKNHYIEESMSYLSYKFRNIPLEALKNVFINEKYNLSNAVEKLLAYNQNCLKNKRKLFEKSKLFNFKVSDNIELMTEIAYIDNKDYILKYIEVENNIRMKKIMEAKSSGQLKTCVCCWDDELLSTEVNLCDFGHNQCLTCIKKSVEIAASEGKLDFKCCGDDCNEELNLAMIKNTIDDKLYQRIIRLKQMKEMKAANIEGFETCAFCDYSVILSNNIKIINCLNPECLKDTCRVCREESHFPFKCGELEGKDPEVQVRTMIENKMSDVLIRTCSYCDSKYIKTSGCNQITCNCGRYMCYICKKSIDSSYNHYYHVDVVENKCPLVTDEYIVHIVAVEAAARLIFKELKTTNPGLLEKIDVNKFLPTKNSYRKYKISLLEINKLVALIIGQDEEDVKNLKYMKSLGSSVKKARK